MNRRKFRTEPEILLIQGKELVKTVKDRRYLHRITSVNFVLGGMPSKKVSEFIKEHRTTIDRWVKIVNEQGWEKLKGKSTSKGRPTKITEEIAIEIEKIIQENPAIYGYAEWNGITLSDLLKKCFHIEYSVRSSQRLLRELDFNLLRPRTFPAKDEGE